MKRMLGAGLMALAGAYFFDPQSGARRRNETRDRVLAFFRRRGAEAGRQARYAEGVAHGVAHKLDTVKDKATGAGEGTYDDATLQDKVQSEIFRGSDAPKDRVSVNAEQGVVFLRGQLDNAEQIEALVAATRKVKGVREVKSLLHQPGQPAPTT